MTPRTARDGELLSNSSMEFSPSPVVRHTQGVWFWVIEHGRRRWLLQLMFGEATKFTNQRNSSSKETKPELDENMDQKAPSLIKEIVQARELVMELQTQLNPSFSVTTPNSSISNASDFFQDGSRKRCRKAKVRWTEQVRGCEQTGLEIPLDDGYGWRKYGQKDILGATYPRAYYKCSYRSTQDCLAMKQVQRSDLNSSVFNVTYIGKHSCIETAELLSGEYTPNKQEPKENKSIEETYINFQTTGVQVSKDKNKQLESHPSFSINSTTSLQPANISNVLETRENHFISTSMETEIHSPTPTHTSAPTTPGSNHKMHNFGGYHSGVELLQTTADSLEELDEMIISLLAPIATSSVNNDHPIHS